MICQRRSSVDVLQVFRHNWLSWLYAQGAKRLVTAHKQTQRATDASVISLAARALTKNTRWAWA